MIIKMADSVNPEKIPVGFRYPPQAAMAYADGLYKWRQDQIEQFDLIIKISAIGVPEQAHHARACDCEFGDYNPELAAEFCHLRREFYPLANDDTCYCSRDTVRAVQLACDSMAIAQPSRWIIATLDGQPWTPLGISQDLAQHFDTTLEPEKIWAIQNIGLGDYDVSHVFGKKDFNRRHAATSVPA